VPTIAEDADAMHQWVPGFYQVSLRVVQPDRPVWNTNSVAIALAPQIEINPLNVPPGDVVLTVTCRPRLRPVQEAHASLIFGDQTVLPDIVTTPSNPTLPTTLAFTVPSVAAGEYLVRLRVLGVDSLPIVLTGDPPTFTFDSLQKVTVA